MERAFAYLPEDLGFLCQLESRIPYVRCPEEQPKGSSQDMSRITFSMVDVDKI